MNSFPVDNFILHLNNRCYISNTNTTENEILHKFIIPIESFGHNQRMAFIKIPYFPFPKLNRTINTKLTIISNSKILFEKTFENEEILMLTTNNEVIRIIHYLNTTLFDGYDRVNIYIVESLSN